MVTDKTRRSAFIEQNLGLVHSCAGRFRGRGIEYDDLYSAGCMGLVKITVMDKGVGIPDSGRAMEPLFTTGNPEERSGLGCAVMQSFMDKVKVSSQPGKGTRVVLTKRLDERST